MKGGSKRLKRPEEFVEELAAIKLALGTIQYSGGAIKKTFSLCIKKYLELYDDTSEELYLKNALLHMQAFLEMGFVYEEFSDLFEKILDKVGVTREEMFPKRYYHANKIKLVKGQVRSMIHRWSPSKYHTMTINEVVDDIIKKVRENQKGHYYYHSNNNPKGNEDDNIYELVITEEETFFYDIVSKKYYVFTE